MNYENEQVKSIFENFNMRIAKTAEFMRNEYSSLKAGRANPKVLDKILVENYGSMMPINQLGNISVPDARTITIAVWDKSAMPKVEKAILAANIGLTPQNDGTVIRLNFPELTQDRRKELVKTVKKLCEDAKVAVRNIRRDALEGLKKQKNDKTLSEDSFAAYEKEIDKLMQKEIEQLDKIGTEKETEILSV